MKHDMGFTLYFFKVFALVSLLMIIASVGTMCMSSVKLLENNEYIEGFEYFFCAWFTLEFLARFMFCPDKIAFFKEIMTWVDLISLLPFYGKIILRTNSLNFLRSVRLIRVFRALKAFAFTSGLQIIVQSLKASFRELILLVIILLIPVVVFSSILYEIEVKEPTQAHFKNIPESFWWAIITMTTVGYGDMVPKTVPGRIIGGVCAIFGVLIVALPVSVIGNNFSTYYSHAQARLSLPKKKRRVIYAANLRPNILQENMASSNTCLHPNDERKASTPEEPQESSGTKYRRYHRRSRTLFAHGDVYIGPSRLERNKLRRGDTCLEESEGEAHNENECTSETKNTVATGTEETVVTEELPDNYVIETPEEMPPITALPRNFTLINSTHESEEIIEEDTRSTPAVSERRNGSSKRRHKPVHSSPSYRQKTNITPSRSWVEIQSENSVVKSSRPQSSRMRKPRVSPTDTHSQGNYKNKVDASRLSPPSVPSFKLDMETTRLDKTGFPSITESEGNKLPNSMILTEKHRRTDKTNSNGIIGNGFHA
ncbi:PREDICTED: potassium voltage-gated channel subfamily A member 1-like [Acropora digitifera]|uniref:potassium voltage-gated channel subfamily A member 1-like n=1 Tax=Acropora digitifera TaxID=70779 RepID=UPI00077ADD90|nr:PREDICTED: potassium voltage-gated channel subfamily A member 1-like [Acropora digitifera]